MTLLSVINKPLNKLTRWSTNDTDFVQRHTVGSVWEYEQ